MMRNGLTGIIPLSKMQKLRSKNSRSASNIACAKKAAAKRRSVLPGYPIAPRMFSKEEIENYLSEEKIVCLLCGKSYFKISFDHLGKSHGIKDDDYRDMYGMPYSTPLCGKLLVQKKIDEATKRYEEYLKNGVNLLPPREKGQHTEIKKRDSRASLAAKKQNIKKAQMKFSRDSIAEAAKKRRRLEDWQVEIIRTSPESGANLARKFGVSTTLISNIRKGIVYKEINSHGGGDIPRYEQKIDTESGRFLNSGEEN